MTSFVRSLKRAVSSGKEGDSPSPQESPLALNQQARAASLATSPSFSDFSLSAHIDAENEFSEAKPSLPAAGRSSLEDFTGACPRWLRSKSVAGDSTGAAELPASQPKSSSLASQLSAPPQAIPRRREGKIGGMDYYDYCELIRGSSL